MNRIRQLREEKHITQVRLSIELEVSQETISAYEKGKYCPSVRSLLKLRDILDANIDYILGLSDMRHDTIPVQELRKDELEMLRNYRRLSATGREKIKSYMDGYLDCLDEQASDKLK